MLAHGSRTLAGLCLQVWRGLLLHERRCCLCHGVFQSQEVLQSQEVFEGHEVFEGQEVLNNQELFCPPCTRRLTAPSGHCPRCGRVYAAPGQHVCGDCLHRDPPWEGFRMLGPYRGALRELLLRAKFHGDAASLHGLGALLAPLALSLPTPNAVIPMPLHPARLRERGFNQCQELCRPMAQALGLPLAPHMLRREVNTAHQRGLSAVARRQNLRGAFVAAPDIRGMRLLLVDDVCTTGTTLRQAAQTLVSAGAVVDVVVAGRA